MPIKPDELNRGPWTAEEDLLLTKYVQAHGIGSWSALPKKAGLLRCGKSCRLRWMNYLRPNVKRGHISQDEEELIIRLHNLLGNRWSLIAGRMPGRTDNEVKNYWNTRLSKKLAREGIDPKTHRPLVSLADKKLIKKPFAIKSADLLKIKGFGSSDSSPNQKQLITKPTAPQEETCMNARPDTIRTTADMALEASGMESVQGKNPPVPNGIVISSNVEYSTHEIHDVASELAETVRVIDKTVEIMSDNTATHVGEAFVNLDAPSTAECMVADGAEQEASNNSYYNVVTAMAHHYCLDDQLVLDFNYNIQQLNPYSEVGEYLYDFNCVHFDQEYQCQGTMLASDLWSLL